MAFEVDFLPVGEGERSGDALALRYGNLGGDRRGQTVVIIDGGTKESGERLVEHVQKYYATDRIDFVISTHPDNDHVSGLTVVLAELRVGTLLMHQPWRHAEEICEMFENPRLTPRGLKKQLVEALSTAREVEKLANSKQIRIIEPFAGVSTKDGSFLVLGPTEPYYESLLPCFRGTPEPKAELAALVGRTVAPPKGAIEWVRETTGHETLDDTGETEPENNSSVISLFTVEGQKLLFAGDAGIPALTAAADWAESEGIGLGDLRLLHVPHHGSKRNVGPTILNRIRTCTALISAAEDGAPKHPAKKVTNALIRRGARVYVTQGRPICHSEPPACRASWTPIAAVPFYDHVEA